MADTWEIDFKDKTELNAKTRNSTSKGDPRGEYPTPEYFYKSSVSNQTYKLSIGGGDPSIDLGGIVGTTPNSADYSQANIRVTKSGHALIFEDAGGEERIILRHKDGTGIEMRQDGSMIMRTETNMITSVGGSGVLIIDGDLKVSCKNVELDATGDMDMRVAGDYNLTVDGHKTETIKGSDRQVVTGNKSTTVTGNVNTTTVGTVTNTILGNATNIIKGYYNNIIGGTYSMAVKGFSRFTSQTEVAISSGNINMAAADLSIFGAAGTIGGANVTHYGKNYFGNSAVFTGGLRADGITSSRDSSDGVLVMNGMTAATFTGDLTGTADKSIITSKQDFAENLIVRTVDGAASIYTNVNTATSIADSDGTAEPTASLMAQHLKYSLFGTRTVNIDEGDGYKNKIDLHQLTGGVTNTPLTTRQIRVKLKDPNNAKNAKFITYLESNGLISKSFSTDKVPPGIGRSYDGAVSYIANKQDIGVSAKFTTYLKAKRQNKKFIPDSRFNPMRVFGDPRKLNISNTDILGKKIEIVNTGKHLLGPGIPISTFLLGGVAFRDITPSVEKNLAVARQLLLQAEVIKFKRSTDQFKNYSLTVTEGVYKKYTVPGGLETSGEVLQSSPPSIPFLAQTGRAITYELHSNNNSQSAESSFNFARRLADSLFGYDKIILNYDTIQKDKLHIQIIVIMSEVDEDYNPAEPTQYKLETRYNNALHSADDLIEVVTVEPAKSTAKVSSAKEKIKYAFGTENVRDRKVNSELEKALSDAAITAGLDYVEIYSGKQPGTDNRRIGDTRHDTGLAAQVRLIFNGKPLNSAKARQRAIMTQFVKAAVANGILGGGHGPEQNPRFMDNFAMHLDMLGAYTGLNARTGSGSDYDKETKFLYRSDQWFKSAFGIKDA